MHVNGMAERIGMCWKRKILLPATLTIGFLFLYLFLQPTSVVPGHGDEGNAAGRMIPFVRSTVYLYESLWILMPIIPWLMVSREELNRYARGVILCRRRWIHGFLILPDIQSAPDNLSGCRGLYGALIHIDKELNAPSFPSCGLRHFFMALAPTRFLGAAFGNEDFDGLCGSGGGHRGVNLSDKTARCVGPRWLGRRLGWVGYVIGFPLERPWRGRYKVRMKKSGRHN